MALNIFTDIGNWFSNLFREIGYLLSPIQKWFSEVTKPIKDFVLENTRNPFLWVGIIVIGLLVFELVYKSLNKK